MANSYYFKDYSSQIIELYFESIPSYIIRQQLKQHFWRWNPDKNCWYSVLNSDAETFAKQLGASGDLYQDKYSDSKKRLPSPISSELQAKFKTLGWESMGTEQLEQLLSDLDGPAPEAVSIPSNQVGQDSVIIVTVFSLSGKLIEFGIVKDVTLQNSSKNIYWIQRSISQKIIQGIIDQKPWILYNGEPCLIRYFSDSLLLRQIKAHSTYFANDLSPSEIWIYSMKMPCPKHPKAIESVTAYIPVKDLSRSYPINVNYCSVCKKYYINADQYRDFALRYGLPVVRLMFDQFNNYPTDSSGWCEESTLHVMGYNVSSKDNLSDDERHQILLHAIKTNTLTKPEIISFLEFLVHRNEGNLHFANACSKWREDIEFIRKYNLDAQRKIVGNFKLNNPDDGIN